MPLTPTFVASQLSSGRGVQDELISQITAIEVHATVGRGGGWLDQIQAIESTLLSCGPGAVENHNRFPFLPAQC